eukprot:m.35379 g.35379  ORF g.35379 m.35379 type:complete len:99 (+) comp11275_c0_seq1:103-399(+)
MDLAKMDEETKLYICRRYFQGGFFCLPFLWFVNSVWFCREAFKQDANPEIRKYVILSFIGAVIWAVGIGIWASAYQNNREDWGASGDDLAVYNPKGKP